MECPTLPLSNLIESLMVAHFWWATWVNRSWLLSFGKRPGRLITSFIFGERPWAIRSGCSPKMSDHEQIPLVAHQKWAIEQIARFLSELLICSFFAKNERFAQKTDERIPSPDCSLIASKVTYICFIFIIRQLRKTNVSVLQLYKYNLFLKTI